MLANEIKESIRVLNEVWHYQTALDWQWLVQKAANMFTKTSGSARMVRWKQIMKANVGQIDLQHAKQFEADHFDAYLRTRKPGSRTLCSHGDLDSDIQTPGMQEPFYPLGTLDCKVIDSKMAKQMSFLARWGSACGRAFNAKAFLEEHPQYGWANGLIKNRPSQQWTEFKAGEYRHHETTRGIDQPPPVAPVRSWISGFRHWLAEVGE